MTTQTYSAPTELNVAPMVFKPASDRTRWEGLAVVSWVLLIDLALIVWLLRRPADGTSFLLLSLVLLSMPLLIHLFVRIWGALTLKYTLDRNAVRIHWASASVVIPLASIKKIVAHGAVSQINRSARFWPAPFMRPLPSNDETTWELHATRPPEDSVWLQTEEFLFSISPADPDAFLAALQEYHQLGPSHSLTVSRVRPGICGLSLLDDRLGRWLLICGLAGVLLLFAALFFAYPNLPERLIFHYNEAGLPDSVRPKGALFLLPAIGLAVYLVNGLAGLWMACRRQRNGAYLLWGGTLSVQVLSLLALFSLTR